MHYELDHRNDGLVFIQRERPQEWAEIVSVLQATDYQFQICQEAGRTSERIFSPSVSNDVIANAFRGRAWESNVGLANPDEGSGRDMDLYKNGVVAEVQFAHYALMGADISRMERLHAGELRLSGRNRSIVCGVEIVVTKEMPTSQSVGRLGQLQRRYAGHAQTIPLVLVGIGPPHTGDRVRVHRVRPRARRSEGHEDVVWP